MPKKPEDVVQRLRNLVGQYNDLGRELGALAEPVATTSPQFMADIQALADSVQATHTASQSLTAILAHYAEHSEERPNDGSRPTGLSDLPDVLWGHFEE